MLKESEALRCREEKRGFNQLYRLAQKWTVLQQGFAWTVLHQGFATRVAYGLSLLFRWKAWRKDLFSATVVLSTARIVFGMFLFHIVEARQIDIFKIDARATCQVLTRLSLKNSHDKQIKFDKLKLWSFQA
jgi:hypothetical protein